MHILKTKLFKYNLYTFINISVALMVKERVTHLITLTKCQYHVMFINRWICEAVLRKCLHIDISEDDIMQDVDSVDLVELADTVAEFKQRNVVDRHAERVLRAQDLHLKRMHAHTHIHNQWAFYFTSKCRSAPPGPADAIILKPVLFNAKLSFIFMETRTVSLKARKKHVQ